MANESPAPESRADFNRVLTGAVVGVAVFTAAVHVVAARRDLSWMWGAHFYGFYPPWLLITSTLALAAVIVATLFRRESLARVVTKAIGPALVGRRMIATAALCVAAGTASFWIARACHTYLGDGSIIVEGIDTDQTIVVGQPLTSLIQVAVYRTTTPWFYDANRSVELNAQDPLALSSVLAGFLFLAIAWLLARELARLATAAEPQQSGITALLWLVMVSQGYMQLFFGYVENYSYNAVGVLLYLWLSLRYLRGSGPLIYPAFALLLCGTLHLSSLVLGVSFLVLAAFGLWQRGSRARTLRDLAIVAGITVAVALAFSRVREGYNVFSTIAEMARTAFAQQAGRGYTFSIAHYRDFFNEQLLIGPLGMFLLVPSLVAAVLTSSLRRQPAVWFAAVAGVTLLVAAWLLRDARLSYARDWDLQAHTGLVYTTAALVLLLSSRVRHQVVVASLVCAFAASIYHTAPWIALNADETRSLARLETLPLAGGQPEVMISTYYRQRGDTDNQRLWLNRALQVNPTNVNAIHILGSLNLQTGRYEEAVRAFELALQIRPEKLSFRMSLVHALNALNRLPEAIPHLEILARADPNSLPVCIALAEALAQVGRMAESQRAFEEGERLCRPVLAQHPNDVSVVTAYGFIMMNLGRLEEAERHFANAITLDPRASDPHCFLGYVLREQGRVAEAREQFQSCLTMNPTFGGRPEIETWLKSNP